MEEAARIISKAFSHCVIDRYDDEPYLPAALLNIPNYPGSRLFKSPGGGVSTMWSG